MNTTSFQQRKTKNIELEYIDGLKQEIKYLEFELQLLKQRQQEEQENLKKMNTFIYKNMDDQTKYESMLERERILKDDNNYLKQEIQNLRMTLEKVTRAIDEKMALYNLEFEELEFMKQKHEFKIEQARLDRDQQIEEHKNLTDQHDQQILKDKKESQLCYDEQDSIDYKLKKCSMVLQEKVKWVLQKQSELDQWLKKKSLDEDIQRIIDYYRKQNTSMTTKISHTKFRIKELEMKAEERKLERLKQLNTRQEYLDEIQELQDTLDKETNLTDNDIYQRLENEEIIAVREIEYEIQDILKQTKIYQQAYEKKKQEIEQRIDARFHQQEKIDKLAKKKKQYEKEMEEFEKQSHDHLAKVNVCMKGNNEMLDEISQAEKAMQTHKETLPQLQTAIDDYTQLINEQQHQMKLSKIIKQFELPDKPNEKQINGMNQLISDIEFELKTVKIKDNKSVFFNQQFYSNQNKTKQQLEL